MGASGKDHERAGIGAAEPAPSQECQIVTDTGSALVVETTISRARFDLASARAALEDALGALPHFDGGESMATRALLDLMNDLITAKGHLRDLEACSFPCA